MSTLDQHDFLDEMREGLLQAARTAAGNVILFISLLLIRFAETPSSRRSGDYVHVKLAYMKTRRSLDIRRPPRLEVSHRQDSLRRNALLKVLLTKIEEMFGPGLTACYTNRDHEVCA